MKKKCFRCGVIKELELFYKHKQMEDGHLGKCKSCTKKDVQKRYFDPNGRQRIREYERLRFKDPKRKEKLAKYRIKRDRTLPGKYRARKMVNKGIKNGTIIKLPCRVCGNPKSQGHHEDYRKPLQVIWLCFKHHREHHGQTVG